MTTMRIEKFPKQKRKLQFIDEFYERLLKTNNLIFSYLE